MAKTEASCIRNESLAPHFPQQTIDIMKTDFFSLSTDGSNDTGLEKKNSLTVRLFDINTIMIDTIFGHFCCNTGQNSGTVATIF